MIQAAPTGEVPKEFSDAVASAALALLRPELRVAETAAPEGLAPCALAWAADVEPSHATSDGGIRHWSPGLSVRPGAA